MLKWFEYQLQHQRRKDYTDVHSVSPVANVYKSMKDTIEWIHSIYSTPRVTKKTESIFARSDKYADVLAPNVKDIDKSTLEQWIYDPVYESMLERPSHETVYFHESEDFNRVLDNFCRSMCIKDYAVKGLSSVRLHVQHPGQMFPLHFDRPQHHDFQQSVDTLNQESCHRRYFLFLDDQSPGQVFQLDHAYLTWRAGDVFLYDPKDDMHGSANFGYWPRFLILITIQTKE